MAVTGVVGLTVTPAVAGAEAVIMAATATSGVYVVIVDLGLMINGDIVELRIYTTVFGAVDRLAYYAVYAHAQAQPAKYSVPVPNLSTDTIRATIKAGATGTTHAYPCRVVTVG